MSGQVGFSEYEMLDFFYTVLKKYSWLTLAPRFYPIFTDRYVCVYNLN